MQISTGRLLLAALVGVLAATAGCMDGGSQLNVEDAPPASALQANATSAMQDVETMSFTTNMSISGEQVRQRFQVDAQGEINQTQRAMRMDMTSDLMGEATITQYIVDDTMYMQMQDEWVRQNLTGANIWEQGGTPVAAQQELLKNASVEVTGTDVVGGDEHDVWVISVEPDPEELEQFTRQQGSTGFGGAGMAENVELSDVEITQYVDADSYHVRQMDATMNTTVQNQSVSMTMQMQLSEFNEAVSIDLPDAARDARPLQSQFGGNGTATGAGSEAQATPASDNATNATAS